MKHFQIDFFLVLKNKIKTTYLIDTIYCNRPKSTDMRLALSTSSGAVL